jgi:ligand-binding sensor domain-containing protein
MHTLFSLRGLLFALLVVCVAGCHAKTEDPVPPKTEVVIPPLETTKASLTGEVTLSSQAFDSTNSPLRNTILKAVIDPQNRVWVCAKVRGSVDFGVRGLAYYDGKTWTPVNRTTFPSLPNDGASDVAFDAGGTPWFTTPVGLIALKNNQPQLYATPDSFSDLGNITYQVAIARNGAVWVTGAGIVALYDGIGYATVPAPDLYEEANLVADRTRGVWAPTRKGLFYVNELGTKTYSRANAPLPTDNVTRVAVAPNGEVWFSVKSQTNPQLFCFVNDSFRALTLSNLNPTDQVYVLTCDSRNRVWFSVNGQDLYRLSPDGTVQRVKVTGSPRFIVNLTFDAQSVGWMATIDQLLRIAE